MGGKAVANRAWIGRRGTTGLALRRMVPAEGLTTAAYTVVIHTIFTHHAHVTRRKAPDDE